MTILDRIAETRRRRVAAAKTALPLAELEAAAASKPPAADVLGRLATWPGDRRAIIAEIKRRSPSKGLLCPDLEPAALAATYERAGAFAVSVLTEPDHFGGSLADLDRVRGAVRLPLLYKDFVVDPYQLWEARCHGADLVLLIVALLGDRTGVFVAEARRAGLEPLVEVHDGPELATAVAAGSRLVGINNRNLKTFEVRLDVTRRLLQELPAGVSVVSESGLRTAEDLQELEAAGARAFLIGETLVTAEDPEGTLRGLVERGSPGGRSPVTDPHPPMGASK